MVLDECLAYPATREAAAASMQRSVRWAARCRARSSARGPAPDGVAVDQPRPGAVRHRPGWCLPGPARRERRRTVAIGFEGYAIGGLSVGEPIDG